MIAWGASTTRRASGTPTPRPRSAALAAAALIGLAVVASCSADDPSHDCTKRREGQPATSAAPSDPPSDPTTHRLQHTAGGEDHGQTLLARWCSGLQAPEDTLSAVPRQTLDAIRVIVLDPGHGGSNLGAVGTAKVYERFLTLALARCLEERLEGRFDGLDVLLTRQSDTDMELGARTHFANVNHADLFLSLHYNAAVNRDANGIEVFFLSADEPPLDDASRIEPTYGPFEVEVASILSDLRRTQNHHLSAAFAEILQRSLVSHTGAMDRGVRQDAFRVLRGALMPAVVAELGFLTHREEGWRVLDPDYTDHLIDALIEAIVTFDALLAADQWAGI